MLIHGVYIVFMNSYVSGGDMHSCVVLREKDDAEKRR